ncbi:RraA family protein [Aureimonas sp. AU40]|uniref:RraA family protein n=1 Tax=Aureimonas sp. AU40 TaxID=1637747 RepID=UPI00078388EF|nr:RraA family protein [Aureimonas sp. AU40]
MAVTIQENACAEPVEAALLAAYRGLATSLVSDNLDRMPGAVGLRPLHSGGPLLGTALTVRTRRGDNLAIHAGLALARPGDVIVVDGGGDPSQALIGEIILTHAASKGVAGFVIDGAVRDVAAIRASPLPCYARDVIHRGPYKNGPGEVNVAVSVGGLVVRPGDLVLGDEDGIVAMAPDVARAILPAIRAQEARERIKIDGFLDAMRRRNA